MFEKFGEFDSAEELNRAAAAQLREGDDASLLALAEENGIDAEDAKDYMAGETDSLATPLTAALGKLELEARELGLKGIMEDWADYIRVQCVEIPEMASAVRRKGKSLKGCVSELLVWSFENAEPVDEEIRKAARIHYQVKLGIPGMRRAKEIIRGYYLGKGAKR